MKKFTWLASYPKSGNTWLRMILGNIFHHKGHPFNHMLNFPPAGEKSTLSKYCGFDPELCSDAYIEQLRPVLAEEFFKIKLRPAFHKVHDAYTFLPDGKPLLGNPNFYNTIYLIRNPLSIAPSFAQHSGKTLEESIAAMNNPVLVAGREINSFREQLSQKLLSWSAHIKSWTENRQLEILVIRYEDLHIKPREILNNVFHFLQIEVDDGKIINAIRQSTFAKVSKLEEQSDFSEKPRQAQKFFRKGQTDSWKEELSSSQAATLIKHHWQMMDKYAYLSAEVLDFAGLNRSDLV